MLISTLPVMAITVLLFMGIGPISRSEAILFLVYYCGLWIVDIALWMTFAQRRIDPLLCLAVIPFAPIVNVLMALDWLCRPENVKSQAKPSAAQSGGVDRAAGHGLD